MVSSLASMASEADVRAVDRQSHRLHITRLGTRLRANQSCRIREQAECQLVCRRLMRIASIRPSLGDAFPSPIARHAKLWTVWAVTLRSGFRESAVDNDEHATTILVDLRQARDVGRE